MKILAITVALAAMGVAVSAHACGGAHAGKTEAPTAAKTASKTTTHSAAKAQLVPAGYTAVVSKKAGSGVAMAYKIEGIPAVGQPVIIYLTMTSPQDADITFSTDSALAMQNPGQVVKALAGQSGEHAITLVPQAQGRYYLNIFSNAQGRSSATSVPVQVGEPIQAKAKAPASSGAVQQSATGERTKTILVP